MKKEFKNGDKTNRDVLIIIDEGFINFYFSEQYTNQLKWIEEETEKRDNYTGEELTEHLENCSFYTIPKELWIKDGIEKLHRENNWHTHMREKSWFTEDMFDFINNNVDGK